jgi:predicted transcriptional regulator
MSEASTNRKVARIKRVIRTVLGVLPSEKVLLITLESVSDSNRKACVTVAQLAEWCALTRQTIFVALKSLEKKEMLRRQRRWHPNGGAAPSEYQLLV